MLDSVRAIVREAGRLSLTYFGTIRSPDVQFKGDVDLVTRADREVEEFLRRRLAESFPHVGFCGEEGGDAAGETPLHFLVDPIDGTTNFVHGHPFYAISVALRKGAETLAGWVHMPAFDDLYEAASGRGAFKNGNRLSVSGTQQLIEALAATGFACVRQRVKPDTVPVFDHAVYRVRGVRRCGSAAVDLCYVAEGRYDVYWERNLSPWDVAAGMLVCREAGGRITDFHGGDDIEQRRELVATNRILHRDMLELIREAEAKAQQSPAAEETPGHPSRNCR